MVVSLTPNLSTPVSTPVEPLNAKDFSSVLAVEANRASNTPIVPVFNNDPDLTPDLVTQNTGTKVAFSLYDTVPVELFNSPQDSVFPKRDSFFNQKPVELFKGEKPKPSENMFLDPFKPKTNNLSPTYRPVDLGNFKSNLNFVIPQPKEEKTREHFLVAGETRYAYDKEGNKITLFGNMDDTIGVTNRFGKESTVKNGTDPKYIVFNSKPTLEEAFASSTGSAYLTVNNPSRQLEIRNGTDPKTGETARLVRDPYNRSIGVFLPSTSNDSLSKTYGAAPGTTTPGAALPGDLLVKDAVVGNIDFGRFVYVGRNSKGEILVNVSISKGAAVKQYYLPDSQDVESLRQIANRVNSLGANAFYEGLGIAYDPNYFSTNLTPSNGTTTPPLDTGAKDIFKPVNREQILYDAEYMKKLSFLIPGGPTQGGSNDVTLGTWPEDLVDGALGAPWLLPFNLAASTSLEGLEKLLGKENLEALTGISADEHRRIYADAFLNPKTTVAGQFGRSLSDLIPGIAFGGIAGKGLAVLGVVKPNITRFLLPVLGGVEVIDVATATANVFTGNDVIGGSFTLLGAVLPGPSFGRDPSIKNPLPVTIGVTPVPGGVPKVNPLRDYDPLNITGGGKGTEVNGTVTGSTTFNTSKLPDPRDNWGQDTVISPSPLPSTLPRIDVTIPTTTGQIVPVSQVPTIPLNQVLGPKNTAELYNGTPDNTGGSGNGNNGGGGPKKPTRPGDEPDPKDGKIEPVLPGGNQSEITIVDNKAQLSTDLVPNDKPEVGTNKGTLFVSTDAGASASLTTKIIDNLRLPDPVKDFIKKTILGSVPNFKSIDVFSGKIGVKLPIAGKSVAITSVSYSGDDGIRVALADGSEVIRAKDGSVILITPPAKGDASQTPQVTYLEAGDGAALKRELVDLIKIVGKSAEVKGSYNGPTVNTDRVKVAIGLGAGDTFEIKLKDLVEAGVLVRKEDGTGFRLNVEEQPSGLFMIKPVIRPNTLPSADGSKGFKIPIDVKMATEVGTSGKLNFLKLPKFGIKVEKAFGTEINSKSLLTSDQVEFIQDNFNSQYNGNFQIKGGIAEPTIVIRDSAKGGTSEKARLYDSLLSQAQLASPKSLEVTFSSSLADAPQLQAMLKNLGIDVKASANGSLSWKFDPKQGEPSPGARHILNLVGYKDLPAGWSNKPISEEVKDTIGKFFGIEPQPLDAYGPLLNVPLNQVQVPGPDGKLVPSVHELSFSNLKDTTAGGIFDFSMLKSWNENTSSSVAIQFNLPSSTVTIFIPVSVGELITKKPQVSLLQAKETGPLNSATATDLKRWMDSVISTAISNKKKQADINYLRDLSNLINGQVSNRLNRGDDSLTLHQRDLVARFLLASEGQIDDKFNLRLGITGAQASDVNPWWLPKTNVSDIEPLSFLNDPSLRPTLVASLDLSGLPSNGGSIDPVLAAGANETPSTLRYEIRNGKTVRVVGGIVGIVVPEPTSALDNTPAGVFRDVYLASLTAGNSDGDASKAAYDAYKAALQPELTTAYLNGYFSSLENGRATPFTMEQRSRFLTVFLNQRTLGKSESEAALAAANAIINGAPAPTMDAALTALGVNPARTDQISIEKGNLTTLKTQTTEALRIARESGNQLGALLATLINGVLDTLLAKVDSSTKELAFSGGVNAVAAAAQAAGLTFSEFVQLIGRGDLAAFGAVIGDIGEVYKQANLGNAASTIGAGFELVGNALNAIGRQKGDKGLILAGTAVNGVGSVLRASQNGPVGAATSAGFKMAGNLATVLGQFGNSNELQALGLALNAGGNIPALFNNRTLGPNGQVTGGINDGKAALSEVASQIAGLLLGGEAGRVVAGIGSLVSTGFQIAGNTLPGGEGSLYVTAARQLLNILGVKLDPAVNFALGTLSTALAGGPVGWAVWAVGLLFNFAQMGSFSKTSVLAENIDADGDSKTDDMASLRQDFRRGFFGNVRQTGHQILYDVNGVDVRLLQNTAINITPETRNTPVTIMSTRGISYSAVINGQSVLLQLVDGNGTLLNNQGKVPGASGFSEPVGGVFFQVPTALVTGGSPIARLLGTPTLTAAGLGTQRFAAVAVGNPDRGGTWNIAQETGNFIVKIDATYEAINPSTTAINTSKSWVVSPADAAVWRNYIGGNSGTIGGNDPRAKSGGLLANALNDMTAQYRGQSNDPNLYMYMDMNGDGNPDRVRVGLQIDSLREKGDGKVEVWLLNANRKDTGVSYIANSFGEAEEIGAMSNQLMNWGAGRPDLWNQGKDIGSFYIMARNSGALALMREANTLTATTVTALLSGGAANMDTAFARLDQINRALASPFNANDYMKANPGVAAYAGGDPVMAAHHYVQWGNAAGVAVNTAGLVLAKPVSRNTLENAALLTNQTIVSDNKQYFAVFQTDGNLAVYRGSPSVYSQAIWSSMTGWKAEGGSATMQADGNLVVLDASGNAKWSSGTDGGAGVNRGFKLVMQDDGNLVIYDTQGGGALWSTIGGRVAKPVANIVPVAQPVVQPVAQPVVQQPLIAALLTRAQPAVVQPVAQPVVQPVAQPVVQPVAQPVVKPVAQPVVQPAAPLSPIARALQGQLAGYRNVGNTLAA